MAAPQSEQFMDLVWIEQAFSPGTWNRGWSKARKRTRDKKIHRSLSLKFLWGSCQWKVKVWPCPWWPNREVVTPAFWERRLKTAQGQKHFAFGFPCGSKLWLDKILAVLPRIHTSDSECSIEPSVWYPDGLRSSWMGHLASLASCILWDKIFRHMDSLALLERVPIGECLPNTQ